MPLNKKLNQEPILSNFMKSFIFLIQFYFISKIDKKHVTKSIVHHSPLLFPISLIVIEFYVRKTTNLLRLT